MVWVGVDKLAAFQGRRLRRLVRHAYDEVPFYRRKFDRAGLRPERIRGLADLPLIPITERAELQGAATGDVLAHGIDARRLHLKRTSGSSGMPLTIRRTWREEQYQSLFYQRALASWGYLLTDKVCGLGYLKDHSEDPVRRYGWPLRREFVDCRLDPEVAAGYIRGARAHVVNGYASALGHMAQALPDGALRSSRLRYVRSGAELLTPLMRRHVARVFEAPVVDLYGSHEVGTIAWECMSTGELHVCSDAVIVEVLGPDGPVSPGQQGELVVTAMHARAMPFIRYRLGDLVTQGSARCCCGQPFPTLRAVSGRMLDFFPLPSGRRMHPYEIVMSPLLKGEWVGQYRMVQERLDHIVISVVARRVPGPDELEPQLAPLRARLGPEVDLELRFVEHIDIPAGEKFRVSRSLVSSIYDEC